MTVTIALRLILLLMIVGAGYYFWLRPILRQRPGFKELYDHEDSFLAALSDKFSGIKQKVAGALVVIAGVAVTVQDQLVPLLSGVDTTSITKSIPAWAWPLITIAVTLLLNYFRNLADKRE